MTSSSGAPLLLADPITRAEAYTKVQTASAHQSLVRSWPIRTAKQQELYEKRQAEAKRLFAEQQEERKQKELATQTCEQGRQARRQQEELVAQRLEQERQPRIEQERKRIRKQEEQVDRTRKTRERACTRGGQTPHSALQIQHRNQVGEEAIQKDGSDGSGVCA